MPDILTGLGLYQLSNKFDSLKVGEFYERPFLARLLGYKTFHAISRGVVTPVDSKTIILFITKENQDVLPEYSNSIVNDFVYTEGETNHANDKRVINAENKGEKIYLFYRERHHSSFIYYGQVQLINSEINDEVPSKFVFKFMRNTAAVEGSMATEARTHGLIDDEFEPEEEGKKRITSHIVYERSRKNREKALELHGRSCFICGFNFNAVYGDDLARDYIEVHHIESITKSQKKINPKIDLFPVCSNCHSMLHRDRSRIIPIEELKNRLIRK